MRISTNSRNCGRTSCHPLLSLCLAVGWHWPVSVSNEGRRSAPIQSLWVLQSVYTARLRKKKDLIIYVNTAIEIWNTNSFYIQYLKKTSSFIVMIRQPVDLLAFLTEDFLVLFFLFNKRKSTSNRRSIVTCIYMILMHNTSITILVYFGNISKMCHIAVLC